VCASTKELTTDDMKDILNSKTAKGANTLLKKSLSVASDASTRPVFPQFYLLLRAKAQAHAGEWPLLGNTGDRG
jgi:hypothetical protein